MKAYAVLGTFVFLGLGFVAILCQDILALFIAGLGAVLFHALTVELETEEFLKEDGE